MGILFSAKGVASEDKIPTCEKSSGPSTLNAFQWSVL